MSRELEYAEELFRASLARLALLVGLAARVDFLTNHGNKSWFNTSLDYMVGGRALVEQATDMWYTFLSAHQTGVGFKHDGRDSGSLDDARDDLFNWVTSIIDVELEQVGGGSKRVVDAINKLPGDVVALVSDEEALDSLTAWLDVRDGDRDVKWRDLDWPDSTVTSQGAARKRFAGFLTEAGVDGLDRKLKKLDDSGESDSKKVLEVVDEQSWQVATVVDKAVQDGARERLRGTMSRDRRRMYVARGVRPGCCAFCGMLASRGFIYHSPDSATRNSVGDEYHPNCHCFPIVRFSDSELPERNKFWQTSWAEHSSGVGAEARKSFARWVYKSRKESARKRAQKARKRA